jgi:site-specific DNA recombinase
MAQTKNITVIPARRRVGNTAKENEIPKLRVAAYCRVSTDSDEQATSYEAQVEHYTDYIRKNPEWEFAGIFADDGISGTNTKKREEFNRMIDEAMEGNIDMIVTKSISRFARNTLDCLKYIRQLKKKNIPVYFEKENINTMDAKGEVLLTIMASLAQQESQSLSQNVKLGFQYRYQQGQINGCRKDQMESGNLAENLKKRKIHR